MPTYRIFTHSGSQLRGSVTASDRLQARTLAALRFGIPTGHVIDACLPGEMPDDDPADHFGGLDEVRPGRRAMAIGFVQRARAAAAIAAPPLAKAA